MKFHRWCLFALVSVLVTGAPVSSWALSSIQGRVTDSNGDPLSGIYATVMKLNVDFWSGYWSQVNFDLTDSEGNFSVGGIEPGVYRVNFRDYAGSWLEETWDNSAGGPDYGGTDVFVASEEHITNINAVLEPASRIEGLVTGPTNQPLNATNVRVYQWNSTYGFWQSTFNTSTDVNGLYSIGGIGPGSYRINFEDNSGNYIKETWDNVWGDPNDGGTDLVVGSGVVISNINAQLEVGSHIVGRVTDSSLQPLESIYIYAYRWDGSYWTEVSYASSAVDGSYNIGGLMSGTYRIDFYDYNWPKVYVDQAYSNQHGSLAWNNGPYDPVVVGSAVTVSNINAVMLRYGSVSGAVYTSDGVTPAEDCQVVLRDFATGAYFGEATADANGGYVFDLLMPGSYTVHAGPFADGFYLGQWLGGVLLIPPFDSGWWWYYDDVPPPPGATDVVVYGDDVAVADIVLPAGGRISGTVSGLGNFGLPGATVTAFGLTNALSFSSTSAANGSYEVNGLLPDAYEVKVAAASFKDEWWNNVLHRDQATSFAVTTGDHFQLDFDLDVGQSPAYFEITSEPSNALIYVDFLPTTNYTPSVLDMGEAGETDAAGQALAPRHVTVRLPGALDPGSQENHPIEAETTTIHFDLTPSNNSSRTVTIYTDPSGFEVYVDVLTAPAGTSPVIVSNLAAASGAGDHMIFVNPPEGYLKPRPVAFWGGSAETNEVIIPVVSTVLATNRQRAFVQSTPPGATVYVNYSATTSATDVVVDWLDPATHGDWSQGWSSASHTIMLKRPGFAQTAPRYVPEQADTLHQLMVHMELTEVEQAVDANSDGLPDQIQQAYGLTNLPVEVAGASGDADEDGVSNSDEIRAGTNPMDANDVFEAATAPVVSGQQFNFTFKSVPGRSYIVMCSGELGNPGWTYASGIIVATASETVVQITVPDGMECRFFRVIALAP